MKNPFRYLWRSQSRLQEVEAYLTRLSKARTSLEPTDPQREVRLASALQRVILLLYDCLVLSEDIKRTRDVQRQRVYARVFSVIAVDALDYLANPLGPSGGELAQIANTAELDKPLVASRVLLAEFRRKHEPFLREVRNTLIAHTGADGEYHLRLLAVLDLRKASDAFAAFLAVLTQMQLDLGILFDVSAQTPSDSRAASH